MSKEAASFYHLLPDLILAAVELSGVRCTGRLLQLNSLENRVYEVEIEVDQAKLVSRYDAFRIVKFYRPGRWSREQISEEHDFLRELWAEQLPVVAPLSFPDGTTFRQLQGQPIFFAVFKKAGGRHLDEFSTRQLEKVGRTVARLHLIGARRQFQYRLRLSVDVFGKASLAYLQAKCCLPEIMASRYNQVVEQICEIATVQLQNFPLQRIHGDLHFGNTIWNGEECTLLDFDDVVSGPAVQDIWLLAPGRDSESQESRQSILRGYEELRSFDYNQIRIIETLRTLRIVRYCAWIASRYDDPAFQRAFPSFGSLEYWRDQLITLEEQLDLMRAAGIN